MSQEKVDIRKAEKANRSKLLKRKRITDRIRLVITIIVIAVIAIWICRSAYSKIRDSIGRNMIEADFSVMSDFSNSLSQ